MADEFQESEVFFETNAAGIGTGIKIEDNNNSQQFRFRDSKRKKDQSEKKNNKSVPVNIPENLSMKSWYQCYEEDGGIVPPHVVVGRRRRVAGEMACSVCSGNGRTLKGRDLSQVRNSILRMTGFLET